MTAVAQTSAAVAAAKRPREPGRRDLAHPARRDLASLSAASGEGARSRGTVWWLPYALLDELSQ